MFNAEDTGLYVWLCAGIFFVLYVKVSLKWKDVKEPIAVAVFCGALTLFTLLYLVEHPEHVEAIKSNRELTAVGVVVSFVLLVLFVRKNIRNERSKGQ